MLNRYVFCENGTCHDMLLANSDLVNGRYQLVDCTKGVIRYEWWETIEEAERYFDDLINRGRIDDWFKSGDIKNKEGVY